MKRLFALVLLLPIIAFAQQTLYSKTFHGGGPCTGQDLLANLNPGGVQLMPPWESVPIKIVGVEVVAFETMPTYVLAGNGYSPDVMLSGAGAVSRVMYPVGTSFPLPAPGTSAHIDLHYSCIGGNFQAFYTIYYTK